MEIKFFENFKLDFIEQEINNYREKSGLKILNAYYSQRRFTSKKTGEEYEINLVTVIYG